MKGWRVKLLLGIFIRWIVVMLSSFAMSVAVGATENQRGPFSGNGRLRAIELGAGRVSYFGQDPLAAPGQPLPPSPGPWKMYFDISGPSVRWRDPRTFLWEIRLHK